MFFIEAVGTKRFDVFESIACKDGTVLSCFAAASIVFLWLIEGYVSGFEQYAVASEVCVQEDALLVRHVSSSSVRMSCSSSDSLAHSIIFD